MYTLGQEGSSSDAKKFGFSSKYTFGKMFGLFNSSGVRRCELLGTSRRLPQVLL